SSSSITFTFRRDGDGSLPSSATACLKFVTNVSVLRPTLRLISCGSRLAAMRTKLDGSLRAHRLIASRPSSSHTLWKSLRNDSDNLLREPRGRPAGLPDCPGGQGGARLELAGLFCGSAGLGRSGVTSHWQRATS